MNRPQVVLITGASSGIGKSAAKALLNTVTRRTC